MPLAPRSIAARIVTVFFLCITAILLTAGLLLSREIEGTVLSSMDRMLHSKLQLITGLLHEEHGGIELELSEIIAGEYVIPRSGHYYRVMMDGKLLAASPSLAGDSFEFARPLSASPGGDGEVLYSSRGPDNEPVRVLNFPHRAFGRTFEITLAESLEESIAMIAGFRRVLSFSLPAVIAALCMLAWAIARTSLKPIALFSERVSGISHRNLADPVDVGATAAELSGLAASFNDMLDRLNKVFASQKRLVADASHELKTPLTVIRTQCDVALQRERTPAEYAAVLGEIRGTTETMGRLIRDLLSLAKLDAGLAIGSELETVDLDACINEAVRATGPLATERRVLVTTAPGARLLVRGSSTGLVEAFQNLLENAIRCNRAGGTVTITAGERDGKAVIAVSDDGIGFSREEGEHIFERFYRAPAVRNSEGTGLGLSIVRSIIEGHGGEVTASGEPGRGSVFTVILPLRTPV